MGNDKWQTNNLMDANPAHLIYDRSALPRKLYKYRSLVGPDLGNLRDILQRDTLWWGSPTTFNDPFDCAPFIDTRGTLEEKIAWTKRAAARHSVGANRKERRRFISTTARKRLSRGLGTGAANAGGRDAWRDMLKKMGVCCLTSRRDHMLMWGHYADSHRGVCIEFDTAQVPFQLAHAVRYDDDRPVFRPLEIGREGLMEKVLLRKAFDWAYEEEWRIFGPGTVGPHAFDRRSLTGIILGAHISSENEASVREMISSRAEPINVMRATLDDRLYQMSINPA